MKLKIAGRTIGGGAMALITMIVAVSVVAAALAVLSLPQKTGEHDVQMPLSVSLVDITNHDAGAVAWSSGSAHFVGQLYDQGVNVQSNGWVGDYDIKIIVSSSLGSSAQASDIAMSYGKAGLFQYTAVSGFAYSLEDGGLVTMVNGEHLLASGSSSWDFHITVNAEADAYALSFQAVPSV